MEVGKREIRVVVSDESLVPDEFVRVTAEMPWDLWKRLCEGGAKMISISEADQIKETRVPSLSLIGAALEKGEGVPGAYLAERGVHVECK